MNREGDDGLWDTVTTNLRSELAGDEPGEEKTERHGEEHPKPTRCEESVLFRGEERFEQGCEEPVDRFEKGDKCGGAEPDPHPDQGGQKEKPAHLTLGKNPHRRDLPNTLKWAVHCGKARTTGGCYCEPQVVGRLSDV